MIKPFAGTKSSVSLLEKHNMACISCPRCQAVLAVVKRAAVIACGVCGITFFVCTGTLFDRCTDALKGQQLEACAAGRDIDLDHLPEEPPPGAPVGQQAIASTSTASASGVPFWFSGGQRSNSGSG
jgi:hypothetical protein